MTERVPTDKLYLSRPTVRVSGRAFDGIDKLTTSLKVVESDGGMSSLELRLVNVGRFEDGAVDLMFENEKILRLGGTIAVYTGDERQPQELFRGMITAVEGIFNQGDAPELVVLAEDALQRARLSRRTKVHSNARIDQLAKDLAGRLALTPIVTGFGESIGVQVQMNETDLAFLHRLLATRDGDMQVIGDELHVARRNDVRRGTVDLDLRGLLTRARVIADLAHQVTGVTVGGFDANAGQRIAGEGRGTNLGPGEGRRGADVLQDAVGARVEHLGELAAMTEAEARAMAEASFDARARRFVRVDGTAVGNPALRVGVHAKLKGLGPRFDNTYRVVSAIHRFDIERGYETDFEGECAFLGGP